MGPFVRRAFAQEGGDAEILNFALMLQYLEADFYRQGLELGLSGEVKALATDFREQEQDHVTTLTDAGTGAGAKPVREPTFEFPIEDQASFVTLGMTLEDTGVMAFNGAGPKLISNEALVGAGRIVQVEARQAAALRPRYGAACTKCLRRDDRDERCAGGRRAVHQEVGAAAPLRLSGRSDHGSYARRNESWFVLRVCKGQSRWPAMRPGGCIQ